MKKYCVYDKGPQNPIEVWEYIDNPIVARSFWYVAYAIDKYGLDDVMPICMNKMGGYHTCYKPDVICIIEADSWPTIATHPEIFRKDVNNENFRCGWIDTEGNTYMCSYMGHASLADDLVEMMYTGEYAKWKQKNGNLNAPDDFLMDSGWIKVLSSSPWCIFDYDKVAAKAIKKWEEIKDRICRS